MISLPLDPQLVRSGHGQQNGIILPHIITKSELANCLNWHDAADASMTSRGSVKIVRFWHTAECYTDPRMPRGAGMQTVGRNHIVTCIVFEATTASQPNADKSCDNCQASRIGCPLPTYFNCALGNKATRPHWKAIGEKGGAKISLELYPDQVFTGDGKVEIHSVFDHVLSDDAVKALYVANEAAVKIAKGKNNATCRKCEGRRKTDVHHCMACMLNGLSGWRE